MTELTILEERQYPTIESIPYTFLRDRLTQLSNEYPLEFIYVAPKGNLAVDFEGKLSKEQISSIFKSLIKSEDIDKYSEESYEYVYFNDGEEECTQINLPKDIDYRTY